MHKVRSEEASGLYPMRLVTRLTGLSADTIRAWERRHGAVTPSRSSGNTRRFTADEVRRLLLLREATQVGHSIRSIAPLALHELERLVDRRETALEVVKPADDGAGVNFRELRSAYLGALARFDTRRAFDLLMRDATLLDRRTFVFEVVLPVLAEVGERWTEQPSFSSVHAQIVSDQLRSVLMALMRLSPPAPGSPRLLMSSPKGQAHDFTILAAALLAQAHGTEPIYVGSGLSVSDIEWAVRMSRADVLILTAMSDFGPDSLDDFTELSDRLRPGVQVWCSVPPGHPLRSVVTMDVYFHDFSEFIEAMKGLS